MRGLTKELRNMTEKTMSPMMIIRMRLLRTTVLANALSRQLRRRSKYLAAVVATRVAHRAPLEAVGWSMYLSGFWLKCRDFALQIGLLMCKIAGQYHAIVAGGAIMRTTLQLSVLSIGAGPTREEVYILSRPCHPISSRLRGQREISVWAS